MNVWTTNRDHSNEIIERFHKIHTFSLIFWSMNAGVFLGYLLSSFLILNHKQISAVRWKFGCALLAVSCEFRMWNALISWMEPHSLTRSRSENYLKRKQFLLFFFLLSILFNLLEFVFDSEENCAQYLNIYFEIKFGFEFRCNVIEEGNRYLFVYWEHSILLLLMHPLHCIAFFQIRSHIHRMETIFIRRATTVKQTISSTTALHLLLFILFGLFDVVGCTYYTFSRNQTTG